MTYEIELRGVADTAAEVRVNGVGVRTVHASRRPL